MCIIFYWNSAKCHNSIWVCFYKSIRGEIVFYCFLIFLIGNCSWCYFLKKSKLEVTIHFIISWVKVSIFVSYDKGKLQENCQKLLENSWNLPGKNEWPPCEMILTIQTIFKIKNQSLIQDLNLGDMYMNVSSSWSIRHQKLLRIDGSFVLCFMFSLDKYAFFQRWAFLATMFSKRGLCHFN